VSHTKSMLIQVPQPLVPSGLETAKLQRSTRSAPFSNAKMRSDGEELPELIDSDNDDDLNDDEDGVGSDASSEAGAACMVCGSTASGPAADRMLLCDGKGCENGCHLVTGGYRVHMALGHGL
jgi:hypothetical protein